MMGSTPDIPTTDVLMDKSMDRAHSLSSLENGGSIIEELNNGDGGGETASVKSVPAIISNHTNEPILVIEDATPPTSSSSTSTSTSSGSDSVSPSEPGSACTCPHPTPLPQSVDSATGTPLPPSISTTPEGLVSTAQVHAPNQTHPRPHVPNKSNPMKPMACEMCNNYELQLQEVQYKEVVLSLQIESYEKTIKQQKEELKKEQKFRLELEEKYNEEAKKTELETRSLSLCVDEGQKRIAKLTSIYNGFEKRTNDLTQELLATVETLKRELSRVTHENEILLGKTLARSQQLLSEDINLPQAHDDMQLFCLKLREDLIQAIVSKEHIEEQLKSENLFLKEQLRGEQQSKENMEESFAQENELLNTTLESKKLELNDYKKRCADQQKELEVLSGNFNHVSTSSVSRISELEAMLEDVTAAKTKQDTDVQQLRNKVQTLQIDLDNSETVQRDFVKLSQSLQVQLEKIRQADNEVRWQHEDDAGECNTCKKTFHSKKEKTNCKHCGRIFCPDCCSKVIYSGPKQRPNRVCNVCHTLLDNQTACWFVNEAPQSPT